MTKKNTQQALELAPTVQLKSRGNGLRVTLDEMITCEPLTENQRKFFELYKQGAECMLLHCVAGTGKTFIALYRALEEVLDNQRSIDR
mgnify:FL=1